MKERTPFTKLIRRYLLIIVIGLIAVILLASKMVIWGALFAAVALVVLGIQQLIQLNVKVTRFEDNISGLEEKNLDLVKLNEKLASENLYLRERHLQVTQIKSILEMNLFEIDTSFRRTVNKTETYNDREIRHLGCLNVSLKAKYGIDMKELRFRYNPSADELIVANVNPRFLSFGDRKLEWEFFETLEYRRQLPVTTRRWMTSDDLSERTAELKEEIRLHTEESVRRGPEELEWISGPIRENVENTIRVLFKGVCTNICFAEKHDNSFVPLDELKPEMVEGHRKELQKGITP